MSTMRASQRQMVLRERAAADHLLDARSRLRHLRDLPQRFRRIALVAALLTVLQRIDDDLGSASAVLEQMLGTGGARPAKA